MTTVDIGRYFRPVLILSLPFDTLGATGVALPFASGLAAKAVGITGTVHSIVPSSQTLVWNCEADYTRNLMPAGSNT